MQGLNQYKALILIGRYYGDYRVKAGGAVGSLFAAFLFCLFFKEGVIPVYEMQPMHSQILTA